MSYVARYAYEGNGKPVNPDYEPCYLYKSVSVSRARGRYGHLNWQVTPFVADARRWTTRESAEKYIASKFTYAHEFGSGTNVHSHFIIEEVTP